MFQGQSLKSSLCLHQKYGEFVSNVRYPIKTRYIDKVFMLCRIYLLQHRPDPCKPLKNQTDAAFKSTYIDYLSSLSIDSSSLAVSLTGVMCTIGKKLTKNCIVTFLFNSWFSTNSYSKHGSGSFMLETVSKCFKSMNSVSFTLCLSFLVYIKTSKLSYVSQLI